MCGVTIRSARFEKIDVSVDFAVYFNYKQSRSRSGTFTSD
jgi:hypothetical protein